MSADDINRALVPRATGSGAFDGSLSSALDVISGANNVRMMQRCTEEMLYGVHASSPEATRLINEQNMRYAERHKRPLILTGVLTADKKLHVGGAGGEGARVKQIMCATAAVSPQALITGGADSQRVLELVQLSPPAGAALVQYGAGAGEVAAVSRCTDHVIVTYHGDDGRVVTVNIESAVLIEEHWERETRRKEDEAILKNTTRAARDLSLAGEAHTSNDEPIAPTECEMEVEPEQPPRARSQYATIVHERFAAAFRYFKIDRTDKMVRHASLADSKEGEEDCESELFFTMKLTRDNFDGSWEPKEDVDGVVLSVYTEGGMPNAYTLVGGDSEYVVYAVWDIETILLHSYVYTDDADFGVLHALLYGA